MNDGPALHNVTIYVERSEVEAARAFYGALAGPLAWEEGGHIACFGSDSLAVCVHEAEPGRPAGTSELFFWVADVDAAEAAARAAGVAVERVRDELHCADGLGNRVRLHARRPE